MTKDLEQLKAIFLSPELDEETRADNERKLREWEQDLIQHEAFAGWRDHDITKQIVQKAKETYKETVLQLGTDHQLSEEYRQRVFAQQDACKWLLSLIDVDAKGALEQIHKHIRAALDATN